MNMKSVALKMLKTGHGYNKELQFSIIPFLGSIKWLNDVTIKKQNKERKGQC